MNDHTTVDGVGGDGGFDDDISDATVVEDFPFELLAQYAQRVCSVAIDTGRFGNSIGDLAAGIHGHGDAAKRAATLTSAHAHGCNVARCLREALEHIGAANELLNKAADEARTEARRK